MSVVFVNESKILESLQPRFIVFWLNITIVLKSFYSRLVLVCKGWQVSLVWSVYCLNGRCVPPVTWSLIVIELPRLWDCLFCLLFMLLPYQTVCYKWKPPPIWMRFDLYLFDKCVPVIIILVICMYIYVDFSFWIIHVGSCASFL